MQNLTKLDHNRTPTVLSKVEKASRKIQVNLLGSQLQKLPEERHTFTQVSRQAHFSGNPILNFVEPPEKYIQIGCYFPKSVTPEGLVNQLVLCVTKKKEISFHSNQILQRTMKNICI